MGDIFLFGLAGTPVLQGLEQLWMSNVRFGVGRGSAFFSFPEVRSISATETERRKLDGENPFSQHWGKRGQGKRGQVCLSGKKGSSLPLTLINTVLYFPYLSFNFSVIFFKSRGEKGVIM